MQKEWDELLQQDAETYQRIIDLLAEAEKERDLRLGAEGRFVALEQRAKLDPGYARSKTSYARL